MQFTEQFPATGLSGSLLEQLPASCRTREERSRAIRELVSFAMEGPLAPVPIPLTPMPVPGGHQSSDRPTATAALSPLPTHSAPFQTCG